MKMKKIIARIPKDKLLHILGGIYLYLIVRIFLDKYSAMVVTFMVAVVIEMIDALTKKGTGEFMDMVATTAGGASMLIFEILNTEL